MKDTRRGARDPTSTQFILCDVDARTRSPASTGVAQRCVNPLEVSCESQISPIVQTITDTNTDIEHAQRAEAPQHSRRLMSTISLQSGSSRLRHHLRDGWVTLIPGVRKGSKSSDSSAISRHEDSVEGCLFCLDRSADQNIIMLQNDAFFARYDNYPAKPGHIEIVPKRHVESFFDLTPEEITKAYALMRQAKEELTKRHQPDGYTIGVNEGNASGRSVDHLHIHLIPRHYGDVDDPRGGIRQVVPNWKPNLWQHHVNC
jgi:diadenosine tetraphosphate (Ap4A) HIT family hydrolase